MPGQSRPWKPTPSGAAGGWKPWVVKGTESTAPGAPGRADLGRRWMHGQTVGEKAFSCEGGWPAGCRLGE